MIAAVLADDTTGALEAGALLARFRAVVSLDPAATPSDDVVVIDTHTRHAAASEAYSTLRHVAIRLCAAGVRYVYKKTDSTLRGPIGAELDALLETFPQHRVLYSGAYPKLGRTVAGGVLLVDGVPVAETSFARDPCDPVRESSIVRLMQATSRHADRIDIRDASSDMDLSSIAAGLRSDNRGLSRIVAAPAGFVKFWYGLLPVAPGPLPEIPGIRKPLLVCGSLHPASRSEAEAARSLGIRTLLSPLERLPDAMGVALELGAAAARAIAAGEADSLILFGGDTARAALDALHCRRLTPCGEVLTGVPVSLTGNGIPIITKAGGFSGARLVQGILDRLA